MHAGYGGAWPGTESTRRTTHSNQAPLVWRAPEGPKGTGGLRDRPLRAAGSRVAISRAAGPDGARNTSGAASNKLNREFRLHRRCEGRRRVQRAQEGLAAAPVGCGAGGWQRGLTAVPVGGGRAWPGFETTHPATRQRHSAADVEGAVGTGEPGCSARGWRGLTAVPVGGGRARAGLEIDTSEPQARVWRSRGRAAAHRHTQRPGPTSSARTLRGIATAWHSKRGRHQPTPCASALTHP